MSRSRRAEGILLSPLPFPKDTGDAGVHPLGMTATPTLSASDRRALIFGSCVLDRSSGRLRRDDHVIPLAPKAYDVLAYLAEHAGRLVTQAGALRRAVGRRLRRRRRAQGLHPGNPEGAGRRCAPAAVHRDGAPARVSLHRPRDDRRVGTGTAAILRRRARIGPGGGTGTGRPDHAVRAQWRRQHRLPGVRRWSDRPGVRHGVGLPSRMLLDRARLCPVPAASCRVLPRHRCSTSVARACPIA